MKFIAVCCTGGFMFVVGAAQAVDVWHQPWDGITAGRNAQAQPGGSSADIYQFADFLIPGPGALLERITAFGYEESGSDPSQDIAYRLVISHLASHTTPGSVSMNLTRTPASTTYRNGDLVFDFDSTALNPGFYFLSIWVERPFSAGKWFWRGTTPVIETQHYTHNPGGGLGFGTDPVPGETVYGAPADLAFRIQSNVPEMQTLFSLAALSVLIILRRTVATRSTRH